MARKKLGISRREFLKRGAALGVGAMVGPYVVRDAFAASRDRVTIYHSSVADSLNPYAHSSSPIYGNWQHVIEPLIEMRLQARKIMSASWPSPGSFRASDGCSNLRKGSNFTTARR